MKPKLYIGTSGWNYNDWRGRFYPPDLPSKQYLGWYAQHFRTVEVNYSFYHLPRPSTYENWAAQVPDGFIFAIKASRLITHIRRLKHVEEEWRKFAAGAAALGEKLGPILLQFPPSFRANTPALCDFLSASRGTAESRLFQLAFEFRHASWFDPGILEILRQHHAALVIADSERYPQAPGVPTATFTYLRFHGPAELFASNYSDDQLKTWGRRIGAWLAQGLGVYAYFNNDFHGHALANARTLAGFLGAP